VKSRTLSCSYDDEESGTDEPIRIKGETESGENSCQKVKSSYQRLFRGLRKMVTKKSRRSTVQKGKPLIDVPKNPQNKPICCFCKQPGLT